MLTFKRKFPWIGRKKVGSVSGLGETPEPLREFVYLDEVSLGSLLASQKGEVTENITSQMGNEQVAEVGGKISTSSPILPDAEINSRFQTTNSNALQTLRKATAQSLFRELHNLPALRKIQPIPTVEPAAETLDDLFSGAFSTAVHSAEALYRGDLVEFRVKLSASWIFQISSMIAEFSEMFDESPMMFIENVNFSALYQAKNANKVINKLLAGLIPVEGTVSDYAVIRYGDQKFIVHQSAFRNLSVSAAPLRIVGVTEHLAYWKDIRRILFADNEFIILGRLAKNGIQKDWNPIKVADIFKELAPDLAKQIETASRTAMLQSTNSHSEESLDPLAAKLSFALLRYQDRLLGNFDHYLTDGERAEVDVEIANLAVNGATAEGQRSAFAAVRDIIESRTGQKVDPSVDLELRESIRESLGIPLFPVPSQKRQRIIEGPDIAAEVEDANFLDVEVVAIYW